MLFDLLRVLLIPASLVVASGLALALLPQPVADRMIQRLESRRELAGRETIAFLYLGHQTQNGQLRIRGVVRNLTADPLEQLDAMVRLYAPGGSLLETAVVRMDQETIAPGQIARFELVYPKYGSEFSSYSVQFKSRLGGVVPYKDMREALAMEGRAPGGGRRQTETK